jgi:FSR family fosmidomycin resistance protein-like MFS transporter
VPATGHLWADFLQGSIPALIPFLIAERGYSYAGRGRAGARLERRVVADPAAVRVASDRLALPWLMPAGSFVRRLGLACVGWTERIRRPSPRWR